MHPTRKGKKGNAYDHVCIRRYYVTFKLYFVHTFWPEGMVFPHFRESMIKITKDLPTPEVYSVISRSMVIEITWWVILLISFIIELKKKETKRETKDYSRRSIVTRIINVEDYNYVIIPRYTLKCSSWKIVFFKLVV